MNYKTGIDIAAGEQNDGDEGGKALCSTAEALQKPAQYFSPENTFRLLSICGSLLSPFGLVLSKSQMSCYLQRVFSEIVM